jgi:hypothetical protein
MTRKMRSRARRYALVGMFATVLVSLAACVPSAPEFTTPTAWSGGIRQIGDDSEQVTTSVQLLDNEHATVTDFPQGTSRDTKDGLVCLDLSTEDRYTGDVTWSNRNGFSIVLSFGDSSVVVGANASFGKQDWSEVGFRECASDALWTLER